MWSMHGPSVCGTFMCFVRVIAGSQMVLSTANRSRSLHPHSSQVACSQLSQMTWTSSCLHSGQT